MKNTILILSGPEKVNGPAIWKNGLVEALKKHNIRVEEAENNLFHFTENMKKVANSKVVHAYCLTINSIILLTIARILRKKIVFTLHGNFFEEIKSKTGIKILFFVPLYEYFLKNSDVVTFPSTYLYKQITKKVPEIKEKSHVIFNGLNVKKNKIRKHINKQIVILEVTNFNYFNKAKGVIPLIEAVNEINKGNKSIKLQILGNGKYLANFVKLANTNVKFLGKKNAEKYLDKCDMFVHSTFLDNQPYVIIEAMSKNIPIISVSVGGIPEMICNDCITKPSKKYLHKKIREFLTKKKLVKNTVLANNKLLSNFLWKNIVLKFIRIYEI